jgi:outer membrane protein TolC
MNKHFVVIALLLLALGTHAQTPDSCRRLTVTDCIDLALQNNLELQNTQLEIEKARATKGEARTAYLPTVSAQALAFNAANPFLTFGIDDIDNALVRQTLYNLYAQYGPLLGLQKEYSFVQDGVIANVMATEPLYAGGRIRNGNKLARLGIEAAQLQKDIKEDEIRLQTECLYWQIVSLQEKIVTLDQLDRLLDTLDKDLRGAIEAGLAMPTDQYKVTIKKNESQLNRKKAEDGITLLKMALGQYIGVDWQALALTDTLGLEQAPTAYFQAAHDAVAGRHEARLLHLSVEAERLKKKMTLGEALPSLLIGGSANYHTLLDHAKPNAVAFALLQVPITDWHKTAFRLKKHNLDLEIAENSRRDFEEKMELQTNQAWFNLQQSWLRITMAQTALSDAEANLKMVTDYYEAGLVALSDLLEAQTLLQHSRDELSDSRVDYRLNIVKYKQLTNNRQNP